MANGPVFPAFLKLEYQSDGTAKASFLAEVASMADQGKRSFEKSYGEISQIVQRTVASINGNQIRLDVDGSGLRQAAAEADLTYQKLAALETAARSLAKSTGDTTIATRNYITALSIQTTEAQQAKSAADAQVLTYSRLQAELDKTVSANQRLAQSYRDTYLEQARATNAAYAAQQAVNAEYAPGLNRVAGRDFSRAKDSAAVFENNSYASKADTRSGLERMLAGSASIDRAALSFTTLEQVMGRVSVKSREVAAAVVDAARQAEQAAQEEARAVMQAAAEKDAAQARAAAAAQQYASAADRLRAEIDPAFAAQQRYNAALDQADELLKANAISEREHAAAVALARQNLAQSWEMLTSKEQANTEGRRRGTTETQNVINGIRAQRVAFTQLGQQLQDVTVQAQMGTSATTIFVQQVPQMAFALSGLEGNTNKFYSKIGAVATFLAGPWGAAIFAATAVLGPYIAALFKTGDAADDAKGKTYDFSRGLDVLTLSANQTVSAMQQLQTEMRNAIAVQGDYLRSKALIANQSASEIGARLAANQSELAKMNEGGLIGEIFKPGGQGAIQFEMRRRELQKNIALYQEAYNIAKQAAADSTIATAQSKAIESLDKRAAATGRYNRAVADLNERLRQSTTDKIGAQAAGRFISPEDYQKQFQALTARKDAEIEALKKGPKGPDPAKAAKRLEDFGESAAEKIKRINERFDEQPRLIDAAAQSTRELDAIIKDLGERKPIGFEAMIAEAEAAKRVIQDALLKPMQDLTRDSERRVQIQSLILSGHNAEANALRDIWQLEDRIGDLNEAQRSEILARARAEEQVNEVLRQRQLIQQAYLDATQQIRSQLESFFAGDGGLDFGKIFRQLRSRLLVENVFGDLFRDMDKTIRKSTGVDLAVEKLRDDTTRAADAMSAFADAAAEITGRMTGGGSGGSGSAGMIAGTILGSSGYKDGIESIFYDAKANTAAQFGANDNGPSGAPIIVTATREGMKQAISGTALGLSPESFFSKMIGGLTGNLADQLKQIFGTSFFNKMSGVISGGAYGYATGGIPGGIIGALSGIKDLPKGIQEGLGKALKGAQTGTMVSGIGKSLGINMDDTGAQIGGAIGSALPIPGGQIIGAIAGGLIGGLINGIPRGRATVTNDSVSASGNRSSIIEGLNAQGSSIQSGISQIAKQLGATVGQYSVGIGSYKGGYYQVSSNANDPFLGKSQYSARSSQAVYDGKDATAALKAAVGVAIQQGAIVGVRASTQTLLRAGKDIEQQVDKALKFEGVFKTLKSYTDPVGAALDTLDANFKEMISIFQEAGASAQEYADLEKLYGIERANAVKTAMQQVSGSLKSLLDDLTVNNTALSLRAREGMAREAFNPLAARVAAGDVTAFDDFSAAARTLMDVSRQLYGSQDEYFAVQNEITALTKGALDKQQAIADAAANRDSPFAATATKAVDNANVEAAVRDQTDTLASYLRAMNDNLGALVNLGSLPTGIISPSVVGYW